MKTRFLRVRDLQVGDQIKTNQIIQKIVKIDKTPSRWQLHFEDGKSYQMRTESVVNAIQD